MKVYSAEYISMHETWHTTDLSSNCRTYPWISTHGNGVGDGNCISGVGDGNCTSGVGDGNCTSGVGDRDLSKYSLQK